MKPIIDSQYISHFLNETFRVDRIEDASLNGLQVENTGPVRKVALTVDASLDFFRVAFKTKAQMLIVHHGLFWEKPFRMTGMMYERCRFLIAHNMALYAVHLPLDVHPQLSHNAQAIARMGWSTIGDFGLLGGWPAGKEIMLDEPVRIETLIAQIERTLQCRVQAWRFGPPEIRRVGYVSGGGISLLPEAIEKHMDVFITGEPKHSFYWMAKEAGIHVLFAGHYAMEKVGLSGVASLLETQCGVLTEIVDLPTGL